MKDGSYQYVLIGNMPQGGHRGNGYMEWVTTSYHIDPPKKAMAMTVLEITMGRSKTERPLQPATPDRHSILTVSTILC